MCATLLCQQETSTAAGRNDFRLAAGRKAARLKVVAFLLPTKSQNGDSLSTVVLTSTATLQTHFQCPRPSKSFERSRANQSTIKNYSLHIHSKIYTGTFNKMLLLWTCHNLPPDCHHNRLIDAIIGHSLPGQQTTAYQLCIKVLSAKDSSLYHNILAEIPSMTCPSGLPSNVKHTTVHYIRTTSSPLCFLQCPLPCIGIAKAEFEAMLREEIPRCSNGPWASPLHIVAKKPKAHNPVETTEPSMCALSPTSTVFVYPIQDFTHHIHGCHIFSVLDLVKAKNCSHYFFWLVRVSLHELS